MGKSSKSIFELIEPSSNGSHELALVYRLSDLRHIHSESSAHAMAPSEDRCAICSHAQTERINSLLN